MKKLEFITTGNEILSGLTVDTNFSWAAERFSLSGLIPSYHVSVSDDAEDIINAYKMAAGRSAFVIVTGGLGPTSDDLTVETSAKFFGTGLFFDKGSYDSIEDKLKQRGRTILEIHRKQAMFPEGSEIIKNDIGTSNGYKYIFDGCSFYFLPGVPREFKSMINGFVLPDIIKTSGSGKHVVQKIIKTIGLGESEVAERLNGLEFKGCDFSYRINLARCVRF